MTRLILHGVRVDLAHVLAAVLLGDLLDVQVEGGAQVARDGDAAVVRDDGVVDRQDLLQVGLHPRHLREGGGSKMKCIRGGLLTQPYTLK